MNIAVTCEILRVLGFTGSSLEVGPCEGLWVAQAGPFGADGTTPEEAIEAVRGKVMQAAGDAIEKHLADAETLRGLLSRV